MRNLILSTAAAALTLGLMATGARAGECPPAQVRNDARTTGETMPKDVTDTELAAVDLAKEIAGLDGRRLRIRRLVVQPGGIVPWHSHTDRPALIITIEGQVTEFRSSCAVGIVHKEGEVARETRGTSHWWKNEGSTPAVLLSADIINDKMQTAANDHM
jgi:quercetin dioxygenase-like cupin family protein